MIEAEALLAALKSAPAGLTLKQLSEQIPASGGRKPKLRASLRTLVNDGSAVFDGARYRLATHPAPTAPVHAAAPHPRKEKSRGRQPLVPPHVRERATTQAKPAAHTLAKAHRAAVTHEGPPPEKQFHAAKVTPAAHAPAAAAHRHAASGSEQLAEPAHGARAAARSGPAKTVAAKVPAALAEGVRLRKHAQAQTEIRTAPRGAAAWGEAREKKPAPAPRPRSGELVGLIHLKAEGYGFVSALLGGSSRDEDVFVPPGSTADAIDGDIVRVRIAPGRDGRTIGEVVQIVEARRQLAIGTYRVRGKEALVEPHDRRMAGPIFVPRDPALQDGALVKVRLRRETQGPMRGEMIGPLGARGEARFEILASAYAQGFSDEFDAAVQQAAEAVPDHVRPEDHEGRRDLRTLPLVTIDGEDARDFDDAVFVEKSGAGYRLVVAIADVASYVTEEGPIDREALRRATSVYFPGTVLPMLPEELSNGICSLNPDVERLCMVCDLQLDANGVPGAAELYPAVMKSHARLTYTQVAAVLAGEAQSEERVAVRVPELLVAGELAKKMTAVRFGRGALDFDLPEAKIILDEKGAVTEIVSRPRNDAHRLVEEFMLAANEAVARFFSQSNLPTLYRIHDQPDADKLIAFGGLAGTHGFKLPARLTPSALGDLLKQLEGHPAQRALTQLLLRSMMQALYAPDDIGHYGLAAPTYLHFTSPIRRYPDLTVHRLLWKQWARGGKPQSKQERDDEEAQLAGVGAQCSERERAAMRAERDVVSFYCASFMQEHVGEEFRATITGVADLGLFCLLDAPAVEGLVPAESLGHGLRLDTELQKITMGSSGKSWALGDVIQIRVVSAEPSRRRINFAIVGEPEQVSPAPRSIRAGKRELRSTPVHAGRGGERIPPRRIAPLETFEEQAPKRPHAGPREEAHAPARHAQRGFVKHHAEAKPAPTRSFEKRRDEPAHAESGKERWLREQDLFAPPGSKPTPPKIPTAGPPQHQNSSRRGPPPHRGQKPSRRR